MNYEFTNLSFSPSLESYAQLTVNCLPDHLYDDVFIMLQKISPDSLVTLGNPSITAPASWWGDWFGLSLIDGDLAELEGGYL